jgi:hypothetical protein
VVVAVAEAEASAGQQAPPDREQPREHGGCPLAGSDQDWRRCVRFGCLEVADWMVHDLQGGELACEVDLDVISTR